MTRLFPRLQVKDRQVHLLGRRRQDCGTASPGQIQMLIGAVEAWDEPTLDQNELIGDDYELAALCCDVNGSPPLSLLAT